ncbi:type II secretion system protein GspM [Pantoea sp. AMG 501]|nr:type II secretion system protein GspM [Pantoea sp. AMG 501]
MPFESLLSWLAALQREHGIRVLALAVERAGQAPGVVQVSRLQVTTQPSM